MFRSHWNNLAVSISENIAPNNFPEYISEFTEFLKLSCWTPVGTFFNILSISLLPFCFISTPCWLHHWLILWSDLIYVLFSSNFVKLNIKDLSSRSNINILTRWTDCRHYFLYCWLWENLLRSCFEKYAKSWKTVTTFAWVPCLTGF